MLKLLILKAKNFLILLIKKTLFNLLHVNRVFLSKYERTILIIDLLWVGSILVQYKPNALLCTVGLTNYFWVKAILQIIWEKLPFSKKETVNQNAVPTGTIEPKVEPKIKLKEIYKLDDYLWNIKVPGGYKVPFLIGMNEKEIPVILDLDKLGTMLISAVQGGGKSCAVNDLIQGLQVLNPQAYFLLADFKRVELCYYKDFDNTTVCYTLEYYRDCLKILEAEMEYRYDCMENVCNHVHKYNKKMGKIVFPDIVHIGDEMMEIRILAGHNQDLVDEIENLQLRILTKGRAAGIYMVFTTLRPDSIYFNSTIKSLLKGILSGRIVNIQTQGVVGVKGTEGLKPGEFILKDDNGQNKYKVFFVDFDDAPEVYEKLYKMKVGAKW